ncbi:MAG: ARMT1-like domain-containing protein [Candidatus Thermoplasmatota archaeon]
MKIHPECVPCLLKRCLYESELVDEQKKREIVEAATSILDEKFDEDAVSAEVATEVHGKVYEILDTDDPYSDIKERSNALAEKLLPQAKKISENSFKDAVLVSIAGNVLDFGYRDDISSPDYLSEEFENIIDQGLAHDDTEEMEEILEKGKEVVYFTDNAGEIVFDTLLLKRLRDYDVHLTVVVKGESILTDVTMKDALKYDIDEIADQVETTGAFAVGVDFDLLPEKVEEKLKRADLIIAKGMANWESFSETDYSPIAFLTRSKCEPVSNTMGVPYDENIAKLFKGTVSVAH